MSGPAAILLVESDLELGPDLAEQLSADGYDVQLALSAEHARHLAGAAGPELAILGSLPDPAGSLALLREIRHADGGAKWQRSLPAILLSARSGEIETVRAFEAGADDVLARDAGYLELRARVAALLRRTGAAGAWREALEVGTLRIDARSRQASLSGRPLALRRLEFDVLSHLARDPTRVFAREELLRAVWGYRASGCTRTVDSHASRLRTRLDPDRHGGWVVSVRGVGYRLI